MKWREQDSLRWLEAELGGARVAFSTRHGGVSSGPFTSLNLGLRTGDDRRSVRTNRALLASALELDPGQVAISRQVHGAELVSHEGSPDRTFADATRAAIEADGHHTTRASVALAVLVADCLPIALEGPRGVAMLHCGWRGLAAGIVERGAAEVEAEAAAIGPGIGPCCYEVGSEVLDSFAGLGEGVASGGRLDLRAVARRQLGAAGVDEVEASELCTSCEPELFFSHRRDAGNTGRQCAVAWIDES